MKKIPLIFLISIIFFSNLLFVPKIEAAFIDVPVAETGSPFSAFGSKEGLFGTGIGTDWLATFAAKLVINQLTASIVNWINTGFEGNPTFIENTNEFLRDTADQATGLFIHEMKWDRICSPFATSLRLALEYNVPFNKRMQCTLSQAVENIEAFQEDFSQGGWKAWLSMTTQPQNNIYGAYLMSLDEMESQKAKKVEQEKMELSWGGGTVSLKKCSGGQSQSDFCMNQCDGLGDEEFNQCHENCMEVEMSEKELCDVTGGALKTTTPGTLIADQIKLNLGTTLRQLEIADEVNESVSAIVNALISQLINQGLSSLTDKDNRGGGWQNTAPSLEEKMNAIKFVENKTVSEKMYRDAKQNSFNAYNSAISGLNNLKLCYEDKILSLMAVEPVDTARISAIQAKIDVEIQPQINDLTTKMNVKKTEVDKSNKVLSDSEKIKMRISSASSSSVLANALDDFKTKVMPNVHSAVDSQNADLEYQTTKTQLDAINTDTNIKYNKCLAGIDGL